MATLTLPFSMENKADSHDMGLIYCDLYQKLPQPLQEVSQNKPHVLEYLHLVPISEVGMPRYCPELSRKTADDKNINFIYPTNSEDIFIHVLADPTDSRDNYIPIEPTLTLNLDSLMHQVEVKLLDLRGNLARIENEAEKRERLLEYIDQITTVVDQPVSENPGGNGSRGNGDKKLLRIPVTQRELEGIKYLFLRDKLGMGALDPLIVDPYIEDISCSGLGHVFIEHQIFKGLKSTVTFASFEELDEFVLWLAERIRKPVTYREPIADATLPDGSRINIVYGSEVSKRGSNFTIRKFKDVPISIFELVEFGSLNYQILAYLSLVIGNGMNVFVSGETASGKTTLLNAVTTFIHPLAKVVSIEDTPELQVPHKNWIREVVQTTKAEDGSAGVTMFDLLKAALRQRPNEVVVGEIRGREGNVAFQAMQTGHSVMATFHAASVEKLIQRMTGDPISVPKTYVDNLNVVIFTSMVKLPTGRMGRRVTGVEEIVGYDPVFDSFSFVESFNWNEETDQFEFTGYMTSHILENKVVPRMGIPANKKRRIYAEMERRAKILEKLHKEQKVTGFYELLEVLGKAQREGLF
jgi:flagellar protein FlaI